MSIDLHESPYGRFSIALMLAGKTPFWLRCQIISGRARFVCRNGKPLVHLGDVLALANPLSPSPTAKVGGGAAR